jgi:hypothetical protein
VSSSADVVSSLSQAIDADLSAVNLVLLEVVAEMFKL